MKYSWVDGGVTAAVGFRAAGMVSGIKVSGKLDLALVVSDVPAVAAGSFTKNLVQAASVVYDRNLLQERAAVRAMVVNSGNANAATGQKGVEAVQETVESFAKALGVAPEEILVASTGVIGVPLPIEKIRDAAPSLAAKASREGYTDAAQAILTTDLTLKQCAVQAEIDGKTFRLGGMAKGSGMIHPNMATMLAFVTSDCDVEVNLWRALVAKAVDCSFNQITVDGDTSTNDLLIALANGQAGNKTIADPASPEALLLEEMLVAVCVDLAKAVVRDGEGATKLIEVQVSGATEDAGARQIAKTVVGSSLVKSAMFGNDPNWGRLAAAAGRAGVTFDPELLQIDLGAFALMKGGQPLIYDRPAAAAYLKSEKTVIVQISVGIGPGIGLAWGCDLSYDYVKINAEYTT
ncbi:MAG: bifunctional glutamate N-acetyltransferase/amino-acid acetyltransferase ArgJ [Anaerolineae bacterium]|nr:bifunctional glutamate N-acetyltransferase/amino-acid acetyltransferase ArgJ [Gloeobacterales cyanobacterium ES-bin-313]